MCDLLDIVTAATTLFATGAGAICGTWVAFVLERRHRIRAQAADRVEHGYRALMTLSMMRDHARSLKRAILDPYRAAPNGWFLMRPIKAWPVLEDRLDIAALAFLMSVGDTYARQAVQDALFAERNFATWQDSMSARNAARLDAMARLARVHTRGASYSDADLEQILGAELKSYLQQSAEALPPQADMVIDGLRHAMDSLHRALSTTLPHHTFQFPHERESPEL